MSELIENEQYAEIARKLVDTYELIGHIDVSSVMFFDELEDQPKALARCYSHSSHPVTFFTEKTHSIIVYKMNVDYMTDEQIAMLIFHELMHIPAFGDKLVDHNVKEFRHLLDIDVAWADKGAEVVSLLE